jgi:hypothetical protein
VKAARCKGEGASASKTPHGGGGDAAKCLFPPAETMTKRTQSEHFAATPMESNSFVRTFTRLALKPGRIIGPGGRSGRE